MKPKAFFVVSAWKNDVSWVEEYTDDYIIYDKSHTLQESEKVIRVPNTGYNIADTMRYIIQNYENLPDLIAFLQGNPWEHCNRNTFDKLIYNDFLTPIEDYSHVMESSAHRKDPKGFYLERNNSWYIYSHVGTHGPEVNRYFQNYNDFLDEMFVNPEHPEWIRFSPGAQILSPKENILYYSKDFYKKIMGYVDYHRIPSEAFMVERALFYIFMNKWREK